MLKHSLNASTTDLVGLIKNFGLTGKTSASSTNGNDSRIINPINFSEVDRWCSLGSSNKNNPNTWKISFSKSIFITNYSLKTNIYYANQFQWIAKGKTRRGWVNISTVTSSGLGSNSIGTWPTTNHGPFSAFKITTTENGYDTDVRKYYFCIHKIEFYGIIAPYFLFCTCKLKKGMHTSSLIYILLVSS